MMSSDCYERGAGLTQKVLNCAAVSGVNLGDLLLAELIPWIAKREVTLCDLSGALVEPPRDSAKGGVAMTRVDSRLRRMLPRFIKVRMKRYIARRRYSALALQYDEIWIGGGNLLFDVGCDNLALALIAAGAFHKRGKIVKLLSVGVGPFSCNPISALKELQNVAQRVTVRDQDGLKVLNGNGVSASILIDPAWFLGDFLLELHGFRVAPTRETGRFGVNVMRPAALGAVGEYRLWLEEVASNIHAIARLTAKTPVLLLSAFNGDPDVTAEIQGLLSRSNVVAEIKVLPRLSATYEEWLAFFRLDFVVSHRMHVAISALAVGVPCLVFPWQPKIKGVLETVYGDRSNTFLLESERFEANEVLLGLHEQKRFGVELAERLRFAKDFGRAGYENF
ncbi:polysaccharide pyruvyl transferase family protein [Thauera mechernichensis]